MDSISIELSAEKLEESRDGRRELSTSLISTIRTFLSLFFEQELTEQQRLIQSIIYWIEETTPSISFRPDGKWILQNDQAIIEMETYIYINNNSSFIIQDTIYRIRYVLRVLSITYGWTTHDRPTQDVTQKHSIQPRHSKKWFSHSSISIKGNAAPSTPVR